MGTSLTMGLGVSYEETFAARLQQQLNRACTRPVEVENMGALTRFNGLPTLLMMRSPYLPASSFYGAALDLEQRAVEERQRKLEKQGIVGRINGGWRDLRPGNETDRVRTCRFASHAVEPAIPL